MTGTALRVVSAKSQANGSRSLIGELVLGDGIAAISVYGRTPSIGCGVQIYFLSKVPICCSAAVDEKETEGSFEAWSARDGVISAILGTKSFKSFLAGLPLVTESIM